MGELVAFSSSLPEHLTFSLHTLAARGGRGMSTRDGWGVAFYQGVDVALFREPFAAGDSDLVRFLESHGPSTQLAISHIRHATRGAITLAKYQTLRPRTWRATARVRAQRQLAWHQRQRLADDWTVPAGWADRLRACLLRAAGPVERAVDG